MLDDLNTPVVLAAINKALDRDLNEQELEEVVRVIDFFDRAVLKLDLVKSAYEFLQQAKDIPEHVKEMARQRREAKKQKNWQKADELREKIWEE